MNGVSCAWATASAAVGFQNNSKGGLAEPWNGVGWSVQTTPDPTGGQATPNPTTSGGRGLVGELNGVS